MFCPKCGANLIDGAEFCQKCGAQIKKSTEAVQPQEEQAVNTNPAATVEPPKQKGNKTGIIVAIIVAVVVLIVAGAIGIPAIIRHNRESRIERLIEEKKSFQPFSSESDLSRWDSSYVPTYEDIFNFAIPDYYEAEWAVTDLELGEITVTGKADYSGETVQIYFHEYSSYPYKIECGSKTFIGSDETKDFLLDMADAYMNNEEFIPCTFPKFCGKYNSGVSYATSYGNQYFGFRFHLPDDKNSQWGFAEDYMIEEVFEADTKSSVDLSDLEYGTTFVDMVAADGDTGNFIVVQFIYYGGSVVGPLAGYSGEDEFMEDFLYSFTSDVSEGTYIDYSTYGNTAYLGDMKMTTLEEYVYLDDGTIGYEKDCFALKDDVLILIAFNNYESGDMSEMEAMFSGM